MRVKCTDEKQRPLLYLVTNYMCQLSQMIFSNTLAQFKLCFEPLPEIQTFIEGLSQSKISLKSRFKQTF